MVTRNSWRLTSCGLMLDDAIGCHGLQPIGDRRSPTISHLPGRIEIVVLVRAREPRAMTFGSAVDVPSDGTAAGWIASNLGTFGTVGGLAPRDYERYLLLDYRDRGDDHPGFEGVCRLFEQLAGVLLGHTSTPDSCWFAIWEGYGFESSSTLVAATPTNVRQRARFARERQRFRREDARRRRSVRESLGAIPTFELPNRRYHLLRGPVRAASQIERPDGGFPQPPDLWWPDDRRWFVAGDTDLDWCCIAGVDEVASEVAASFPGRTRLVDWEATNLAAGR